MSNEMALFTTCTAHTGDLSRFVSIIARFPRTRIVSSEILRDEYECGLIRVTTALTGAEMVARLKANEGTDGFVQVVAR